MQKDAEVFTLARKAVGHAQWRAAIIIGEITNGEYRVTQQLIALIEQGKRSIPADVLEQYVSYCSGLPKKVVKKQVSLKQEIQRSYNG